MALRSEPTALSRGMEITGHPVDCSLVWSVLVHRLCEVKLSMSSITLILCINVVMVRYVGFYVCGYCLDMYAFSNKYESPFT